MQSLSQEASLTPRTDAVERFFYEAGRQPVGFVDSGVARVLELELNRALSQLRSHGIDPPVPLDSRFQMALQSGRRPPGSFFASTAQAAVAATPAQLAARKPRVSLLMPAAASDSLGEVRSYEDGAVLYRQGEMAEHVFILLGGQVSRVRAGDAGAPCLLESGQVLGEQAMFEEGLHTETVQAVGQTRCVLLPSEHLRAQLSSETSGLLQVLMALVLEYRMTSKISGGIAAGAPPAQYQVMDQKTYTGPEIHRALVQAKANTDGERLDSSQQMCLRLQTSEVLPTRLVTEGSWPVRRGQVNPGLMLVHGQAQLRAGSNAVMLGQGAVIGVAEALTGRDLPWELAAHQDVNVRTIPVDRALQRLERADPLLTGLAAHLCERIVALQGAC